MMKVLLVDDEDIEREGMAEIIPWESVGMELVDMAWNGIEALEKMEKNPPDIVITDIKMPVMDGIELIRRARERYPAMGFVVLSGYGDYEFTSQAMELGIRHYILKPCDEKKIVEVLLNLKKDMESQQEKQKSVQKLKKNYRRILPHLKEQILYELITKKELSLADQTLLADFTRNLEDDFILLSVRSPLEFDQLDRFAMNNILEELLGEEAIYAGTAFRKELVFLIPAALLEKTAECIREAHEEYAKYKKLPLHSAVSGNGRIEESYRLYGQIQELFYFEGAEGEQELLRYDRYDGETDTAIVDYDGIRNAGSYGELLFEIYSAYAKMELEGRSEEQMAGIYNFALKRLFGEEEQKAEGKGIWELMEQVTDRCARQRNILLPENKDGERLKLCLYAVYRNLKNPDLSLQYLASEVLFMNEDYFGRFFTRCMHEKYSAFLVRVRILLAKRLLAYFPDMKLSQLAEQIGYPADGQYLSKVFKKQTNMLLSDYRKQIKKEKE
ncbi:MAG: response regulator [Lachnospiraceae bacterium]|nr:response regulator [Lachnospiraceae bacterium]